MTNSIKDILVSTWENLRDGFLAFLPGFLSALLIILAGLVVAWVLKRIVRSILRVTRFDRFCRNAGLTHLLARADIRANPSELVGSFLSRAALLAAVNSHIPSPGIIGLVVKWLVTILAFAMALEQLKIASSIVTSAFTIAFGPVMLGLAIAFGLGGRDVARRALEKGLEAKEAKETDGFSHL
jgi:small-conductance mechanosensitive channel